MEAKGSKTRNVNCIVYSIFFGEQYGIQHLYEETEMDETEAMTMFKKLFNNGLKFHFFHETSFIFPFLFDDTETRISGKKPKGINVDKIIDIQYKTILVTENF